MINTLINRKVIKTIANALGELNQKVVYVGGAVVSLYIDDTAAEDIRPTKDIDITLEIASLGELEALREDLSKKGFKQSHEDNVICRFRFEDIKIDVMATKAIGWAPANPWFASGFKSAQSIEVNGKSIKILTLPYFLATKFSAFYERGGKDPRFSHDFEDIVYLLNYTSNFQELIIDSDPKVQECLKGAFLNILNDDLLQEAILGNIHYDEQEFRFEKIINQLKAIVNVIKP